MGNIIKKHGSKNKRFVMLNINLIAVVSCDNEKFPSNSSAHTPVSVFALEVIDPLLFTNFKPTEWYMYIQNHSNIYMWVCVGVCEKNVEKRR